MESPTPQPPLAPLKVNPLNRLATVRQAADAIGLPFATLRRLVKTGAVPAKRIGNTIMVNPDAVQKALVEYVGSGPLDNKA